MTDRCLDLRISLIPCSVAVLIGLAAALPVHAEVYVPAEQYGGYVDSRGVYTVIGNVKNGYDFAVTPTITISIWDGDRTTSKTIRHVPIGPGMEVPFKIRMPEVASPEPALADPTVSFEVTPYRHVPIEVLYDDTLVYHEDGHLTGRAQNTGNHTVYHPKIYAIVHGYEKVLDVVYNMEMIGKMEPGEIVDFSMYPDPSIKEEIFYYSCFGPVDTTVVPVRVEKNGGYLDFRYDSGSWFFQPEFNEDGTVLTMKGYNSFPLETYANFELPPISGNEMFDVTVNGEAIKYNQSVDELGFWHVAFTVQPLSQDLLVISGFEEGLPEEIPLIPVWIKTESAWWTSGQISDAEFIEGIEFMLDQSLISVLPWDIARGASPAIPQWVKIPSGWWAEDMLTDDEYINMIQYLVESQAIVLRG